MGKSRQSVDTSGLAAANKYAADKHYQAAMESIKSFEKAFGESKAMIEPWREFGRKALMTLQEEFKAGKFDAPIWQAPTGQDVLNNDPGYAFRLQQGEKALQRQMNTGGGIRGGANLKAAMEYGQKFASNEYANARQRAYQDYMTQNDMRQQRFNQLSGMAGVGLQTSQNINQMRGDTTRQISNLNLQGAQALGQGEIGAQNALVQGHMMNQQLDQMSFNNLLGLGSLGLGIWGAM